MTLTIISPLYNDLPCISKYLERLKVALSSFEGLSSWQLVFVNDASKDGSYEFAREEMKKDPRIKLISFSRNFGYQPALLAGLTEVKSELYAIIDVDCEDPPELLKTFFEKIKEGNQLVYGIRSQRLEPFIIVWFRKQFYRVNKFLADSDVIMWMAEFSMFTSDVRDNILRPRTTFPFLRTEMAYVGFRRFGVEYVRQKRVAGVSHFNFLGMTKFAIAGILAGTTFPLRAILYLSAGALATFLGASFFVHGLVELAATTILIGFIYILISTPLLGLYLARTYKNVVNRPSYIIDPTRTFL